MIDPRLLLCGLTAWAAVAIVVRAAEPAFTIAVGCASAITGTVVALTSSRSTLRWTGVLLLVSGVAGIAASLQVSAWADRDLARVLDGDVDVIGTVHGTVERRDDSAGPVWAAATRWRVLITAEAVSGVAGAMRVNLPMTLETSDPSVAMELPPPGTGVTVRGQARRTAGSTTSVALIALDEAPGIVREPGWLDALTNRMRGALLTSLADVPPAAGGVVAGLSIGDESQLPQQTRIDMREAGLAHLMAVSGGNVAIVVGAVFLIAGALGLGLTWRVVVSLVVLAGYVALVRPEPSVVRAGVMGAITVLALLIGGRRAGPAVLGVGLIIIVILAPFLALTWGFALSVTATGALILLVPPFYAWLHPRILRVVPRESVAKVLAGALSVTLVAQAATTPVLLLMDADVRALAIPANLLAMPVVPVITIGGLLGAVTGPLAPPLATFSSHLAALPASWIVGVARWAATTRAPELTSLTGFFALILVIVALVFALRRVRWFYVLPPVLIAVILWWVPPRVAYLEGWSMVMCDVGQGDGLVLRDVEGPVILVDVGGSDAGMDTCLDNLGVTRIDAVVLTHFHADHVGGLARVLDTREVGAVWATPTQDPADRAALAAVDARSHGLTITPLRAGDVITFGRSRLNVIWPAAPISTGSIANNASIVLWGHVSGVEILLTGDIEPEAQAAIMARVPAPDVVVAKVPHHGSRFQHPDLPRWSGADVALVSVGADNDYGHPAPSTLAAWQEVGAVILRTDLHGAVSLAQEDDGLRIQVTDSDMLEAS